MEIIFRIFHILFLTIGGLLFLRMFFRMVEFFRMISFLEMSFWAYLDISVPSKKDFLLLKLNGALQHNEMKLKFVLANLKVVAEDPAIKTPYDLHDVLVTYLNRIRRIIHEIARIKMWKKMFCKI